jgi:hypothetical protein
LLGFATLPKALATVYLSPTPNPTEVQATLTNQPHPTRDPVTPSLTPSTTPRVGVFMGASTFATGIGLLPTGAGIPFIVITLAPGTKTAIAALPTALAPAITAIPVGTGVVAVPGTPVPGGALPNCAIAIGSAFVKPIQNPNLTGKLGCPTAPAYNLTLVSQSFQTGAMVWRTTKEIYVIQTKNSLADTFWHFPDTWHDGLPESDPALSPPSAGLVQPIRGFGLLWRTNSTIKGALGWATASEQQYQGMWQDFEHGWMLSLNNNTAVAFLPSDAPQNTTGIHYGPLPE